MGKYLDFYKKCMKKGMPRDNWLNTPCEGLCESFIQNDLGTDDLDLFEPIDYQYNSNVPAYWGGEIGIFTPLRQTVVLFLAAMNNEL
jgi:hypothetical protein